MVDHVRFFLGPKDDRDGFLRDGHVKVMTGQRLIEARFLLYFAQSVRDLRGAQTINVQ
jgi:hypothetical protein